MRLKALVAVVALGAAIPLGLLAARSGGDSARERDDAAWRIFFTGSMLGYIHPCGCDAGLFGGLPRRATHLAKARRPADLLIDLGNLIEGTRPHERLKLSYILEGLRELRYDVLVPGEGELALGADFEQVAAKLEQPRVVCANLVRADTKARVFEPWHVHETPGGKRVAVVGLTSPYQPVPPCYAVRPPAEVLAEALEALGETVDTVIVAGFLDGKLALDLAVQFPALGAVLAARAPKGTDELLRRGGAPVMLGGERGQYVCSVGFDEAGRAVAGERAWLGDDVSDAAPLAALVRRHDEDAKQFGEAFARESIDAFRAASWVGSKACAECHEAEYAVWEKSKHAHAMATLKAKDQDRNPNCMKCHLQDLPPDDDVEHVAGIGCESCHGGGRAHMISLRAPHHVPMRTFVESAGTRCLSCHDEANSPRFETQDYWRRIAHDNVILGGNE